MKTFPPLSLGYSPCPNDTYIFNALVHGHTQCSGLRFAAPRLEDVETLNQWALASQLDVTKVSFHAYGHLRNAYNLLPAGAKRLENSHPREIYYGGSPIASVQSFSNKSGSDAF